MNSFLIFFEIKKRFFYYIFFLFFLFIWSFFLIFLSFSALSLNRYLKKIFSSFSFTVIIFPEGNHSQFQKTLMSKLKEFESHFEIKRVVVYPPESVKSYLLKDKKIAGLLKNFKENRENPPFQLVFPYVLKIYPKNLKNAAFIKNYLSLYFSFAKESKILASFNFKFLKILRYSKIFLSIFLFFSVLFYVLFTGFFLKNLVKNSKEEKIFLLLGESPLTFLKTKLWVLVFLSFIAFLSGTLIVYLIFLKISELFLLPLSFSFLFYVSLFAFFILGILYPGFILFFLYRKVLF